MQNYEEFHFGNDLMDNLMIHVKNALEKSRDEVKIIIPHRYAEVLSAKEDFDALLADNDAAESELKFHPLFCSAGLSAEVDYLDVYRQSKDQLGRILKKANTFEVIPLTNGKVRVSFTFEGVMAPVETYGKREEN